MPGRYLSLGALALALVLAFSGCSKKSMNKVEGKVTLDGQPLDGATVIFEPASEDGRPASGLTGSDGVFHLTTYTTGDGAVPGDYKVLIKKSDTSMTEGMGTPDPSDPKAQQEAMKKFAEKQKTKPATNKPSVPFQYGDAAKTPLKCKVPPDGPLEFPLRSKGG